MILVISDGGLKAAQLSNFLDALDVDCIYHFSSFTDAGAFGRGNAFVGKPSYKSFKRIILENKVNCIIDVLETPQSRASDIALKTARDMKIPIVKFVTPTLILNQEVIDGYKIYNSVNYSYHGVAEKINNTVGNVLFLAKPYNVKAVADLVFDRNALYTPIPAGIEFDVELALEFGIPILNVMAIDDFGGADGIEKVLRLVEARLLITDSSSDIFDKLEAVSRTKSSIVFTQNTGFDYDKIVDNEQDLFVFVSDYALSKEDDIELEPEMQENEDSEYSVEN